MSSILTRDSKSVSMSNLGSFCTILYQWNNLDNSARCTEIPARMLIAASVGHFSMSKISSLNVARLRRSHRKYLIIKVLQETTICRLNTNMEFGFHLISNS